MTDKTIFIFDAQEGDKLADDVHTPDGNILAKKDTILNYDIIANISGHHILEVKVYDTNNELQDLEKVLGKTANKENVKYFDKIRASIRFKHFKKTYDENILDIKGGLNDVVMNNSPIDIDKLIEGTNEILTANRNSLQLFDMLHSMRQFDDLTYVHSVNVALIASILGQWLKFSEKDIRILTISGLLHDIGKIMIPNEILTKPGKLTVAEYNIMKQHVNFGYEKVKNQNIDIRIKEACLLHHEKCDGTGYPFGLKSDQIPAVAKIIAIADVYDALTSVRCYKNAYDHDTAIQMILEGQCGQFNPLLLECLKEISPQLSRTFKKEKDDNREYYEAQRISEEILRQNALPRKDHSQRVIEIMQEKIKFFKENSGKISMEYNAISGKLVLTDGESQKEYQRDNLEFDLYGAYDISEEDIQRVKDSLDSVSSKNKEVSMKVMLKVRGERQMCDLKLHTLWSSLKTDGYIGIVGQLDIVK